MRVPSVVRGVQMLLSLLVCLFLTQLPFACILLLICELSFFRHHFLRGFFCFFFFRFSLIINLIANPSTRGGACPAYPCDRRWLAAERAAAHSPRS
jgi:hypothetical protein